jgi:hypothetical protein
MLKRLSDKRLAKLTEKASKATAGPWVKWRGHAQVMAGPLLENERGHARGGRGDICECDDFDRRRQAHRDAAYIAAASPDVVMALVAEVQRYREERRGGAFTSESSRG